MKAGLLYLMIFLLRSYSLLYQVKLMIIRIHRRHYQVLQRKHSLELQIFNNSLRR